MYIVLVDNLLLKREAETERVVLQPHLGLISLIAVLRNAGYRAELYDPKLEMNSGKLKTDKHLYKNIASRLLAMNPDVIGFTSLGCNFICTTRIAQYVKEARPDIPIMLGGPHATVLSKEVIERFTQFDVIVRHEAELKIIPVIESLSKNDYSHIPGITWRVNGTITETPGDTAIQDLDELPFPAYDQFPVEQLGMRSINVEAGRGCPFKCTFCSTATFFGRRYRLKSAKRLCAELGFLNEKYGITDFGLTHDLFTVNRAKVVEFCNEVMDRGFTWTCSARMDCVDPELLGIMKRSGCRSIYYGIETGSERMQEITKKKLSLSLFYDTLKHTLELDMMCTVSFITGYPQELETDVADTLNMIASVYFLNYKRLPQTQLHLLTPEPGTALMNGFKDQMDYDNYITDFNFPTLDDEDDAIMQRYPDIFMNHHYYKSVLPRSYHICTTSLYSVLQPLEKTIICYLLEKYDRKLHVLGKEIYEWLMSKHPAGTGEITPALFIDYLGEKFGTDSMVYSLAVYRYEMHRLFYDREKIFKKRKPALRTKKSYRMAHNIKLVANIHNCPEIITRLEQGRKISAQLEKRKTNMVLQLWREENGNGFIRNYEVNGQVSGLLHLVEEKKLSGVPVSVLKMLQKQGFLQSC